MERSIWCASGACVYVCSMRSMRSSVMFMSMCMCMYVFVYALVCTQKIFVVPKHEYVWVWREQPAAVFNCPLQVSYDYSAGFWLWHCTQVRCPECSSINATTSSSSSQASKVNYSRSACVRLCMWYVRAYDSAWYTFMHKCKAVIFLWTHMCSHSHLHTYVYRHMQSCA
jgi:hypothetical protein